MRVLLAVLAVVACSATTTTTTGTTATTTSTATTTTAATTTTTTAPTPIVVWKGATEGQQKYVVDKGAVADFGYDPLVKVGTLTTCPYEIAPGGIVVDTRRTDETTAPADKNIQEFVATDGKYYIDGSYILSWAYNENYATAKAVNKDFIPKFQADNPWVTRFTPIYVYCRTAGRSGQVRTAFQEAGYVNVINLAGWWGAGALSRGDNSLIKYPLKDIPQSIGGPSCGLRKYTLANRGFTLKTGDDKYIPSGFECPYDAIDKNGVVLDIRGDTEIAAGAVQCAETRVKWQWASTGTADGVKATKAAFGDFVENFQKAYPLAAFPKTDVKIYIYCKTGGRAGQAVTTLKNAGYTNVWNLGGWPSSSPGARDNGENDGAVIGSAISALPFPQCGCPGFRSPISSATQSLLETQRTQAYGKNPVPKVGTLIKTPFVLATKVGSPASTYSLIGALVVVLATLL